LDIQFSNPYRRHPANSFCAQDTPRTELSNTVGWAAGMLIINYIFPNGKKTGKKWYKSGTFLGRF